MAVYICLLKLSSLSERAIIINGYLIYFFFEDDKTNLGYTEWWLVARLSRKSDWC